MKKLIILSALVTSAASVSAEPFFQASLTPDVAIFSQSKRINGVCISIWGENPQSAFAFGIVNGSSGDSYGFTLGFVNYSDSYTGVAMAMVNISRDQFTGFQASPVNIAKGFEGLQLGIVNYAENLHGLQLGMFNVAKNNPMFSDFPDKLATGFPFVNWSF